MLKCVIRAAKPGGFAAGVMRYPRGDGYAEPSLLVTDAMDSLGDFYADACRVNEQLEKERDDRMVSGLRLGAACGS